MQSEVEIDLSPMSELRLTVPLFPPIYLHNSTAAAPTKSYAIVSRHRPSQHGLEGKRAKDEAPNNNNNAAETGKANGEAGEGMDDKVGEPHNNITTTTTNMEIFGWELPVEEDVAIQPGKHCAVFSSTGGKLLLRSVGYTSCFVTDLGAKFHRSVLDLHRMFEKFRVEARKGTRGSGPRMLCCGITPNCGKTTLVKQLANYAVRLGYHPILLDFDLTLPLFGLPESVNLLCLQPPGLDVETDGLFSTSLLPFCVGHLDLSQVHLLFFERLLEEIWARISVKQQTNHRSLAGGVMVNFPTLDAMQCQFQIESGHHYFNRRTRAKRMLSGRVDGETLLVGPLDYLACCIEALEIDTVLCMGSDWLRHALRCYFQAPVSAAVLESAGLGSSVPFSHSSPQITLRHNGKIIRVMNVECSDAAEQIQTIDRDAMRRQRWSTYFFGTSSPVTFPLSPGTTDLNWTDIRLVNIGGISAESMSTLLPLDADSGSGGAEMEKDVFTVSIVRPEDVNLRNRICAMSSAPWRRKRPLPEDDTATVPASCSVWEERPVEEFEREVSSCGTRGFVLILVSSQTQIKIVNPFATIPVEMIQQGLCLLLCDSVLAGSK